MDGENDAAMSQRIREHLSECAECRNTLQAFQDTDSFLRKLPTHEVSPGFTRQVMSELRYNVRHKSHSAYNLLNRFMKFFEILFDVSELPKSPASLEEFADFPPGSLCKIYFKIL